MQSTLRQFIKEIESARTQITKVSGVQVQSENLRESIRLLVDRFFESVRPTIASAQIQPEALSSLDALLQELVRLTHKATSKSKYKDACTKIRAHLVTLDRPHSAVSISFIGSWQPVDDRILNILDSMVPSAGAAYRQALIDLDGTDRHSWRGPATDLRESLRETLDFLAPDADVQAELGFKFEKELTRPTMKQKVKFILKSRGTRSTELKSSEDAVQSVEDIVGSFVRSIYARSSLSTHTPTDRKEVVRVRSFVRVAFMELLEVHE